MNIVITKKSKYYLIYIYYILFSFIYGIKINKNQLIIYLFSYKLINCLIFLKYNSITNLNSLVDIVVVDNLSYINNNRFELTYVFWSIYYEFRICIKLFTDEFKYIYSLSNLFKSSVWLEREIWDMFGIRFLFHNGLRRILTDYGFKGYPLRKDFPLLGYVDVYYDDTLQLIKVVPIELSQNLRFFKFYNPWNKWYY
jgi:NADH:ubiquinone oxidoreductase subunit C